MEENSIVKKEPAIAETVLDDDGNTRRGFTATFRRSDGSQHDAAVSELTIPPTMPGGRYALDGPVELVVLSIKRTTARCRVLGSGQPITFRASRLWTVFPGEIAVVKPAKQWTYSGNPYLSGVIESTPIESNALGHYCGDASQPIEDWAKPIVAKGPRPQFEMEQVLRGIEIGDPFSNPLDNSDDAHAHLGNMEFAGSPKDAIRHYEVGFRIGELSLSNAFDGVLQWVMIDNRPFLRCMHGYGLCLWRLGKFDEAARFFDYARAKKKWVQNEAWI